MAISPSGSVHPKHVIVNKVNKLFPLVKSTMHVPLVGKRFFLSVREAVPVVC